MSKCDEEGEQVAGDEVSDDIQVTADGRLATFHPDEPDSAECLENTGDDKYLANFSSEKCLTLKDISTAGGSSLAGGAKLDDLVLRHRDLLSIVNDSSDGPDDNASVEANFGDESSCCVSDVSSLSFQNAVLDDPEYSSGCQTQNLLEQQLPTGSDWICTDLQDASELSENTNNLTENADEIPEMPDELYEGDRNLDCDETAQKVLDYVDVHPQELDSNTEAYQDKSRLETALSEEHAILSDRCSTFNKIIGKEYSKKICDEHVSASKTHQQAKSSPGLARRMLPDEHSGNKSDISSVDSSLKRGLREDSCDKERECEAGDQDSGSIDRIKKEKIAHMDALYKKQIEALMHNQSHDVTDSTETKHSEADIENEYDYIKYTRVQKKETYFGMSLMQDSVQSSCAGAGVFPSSMLNAMSGHASEKTESSTASGISTLCHDKTLQQTGVSDMTDEKSGSKLPLDAAESDANNRINISNDERSLTCHMPSVEDGLSSGHASDLEEAYPPRSDPSPAEVLHGRQRSEILSSQASQSSDMLPPLSSPNEINNCSVASDDSSKTRQKDVEQAILDIKSAIEKSKKIKLISPSPAADEQTKNIDEKGQEPVWITRKERTREGFCEDPKNHLVSQANVAAPSDHITSQKETNEEEEVLLNAVNHVDGTKRNFLTKGTSTRKHYKQYMPLPSCDERGHCSDLGSPSSEVRSQSHSDDATKSVSGDIMINSQHPVGMTGNGHATAIGSDQHDDVRHGPATGNSLAPSDGAKIDKQRMQLDASNKVKDSAASSAAVSGQMKDSDVTNRGTPSCSEKSDDICIRPANRGVEGDYSTDEETDELLNKQYKRSERVDIPELSSSPVSRSQNEKRQNRAREVALRDPANETVLIEGVLFRANYLGSTQLISEGQPSKGMRMMQAQEAVGRIKAPEGENQPSTEVDLFVSVEKIMVLNTDLQEIMMDHALRTISYIADIGEILVIMARRGPVMNSTADFVRRKSQTKICCHVFESEEAQLIAQSIGQAFQVSYMEFLKANGIDNPSHIRELDYQEVLNQQEIFGEELYLFSNREMQKEIIVPKVKGEPLGVVIVESGWGSMVPTVVLANMSPTGSAARCGQLNIGDQIMSINGISLVGLPLSSCQNYIKVARHQSVVKLVVVSCPPVVEVLIKRPDIKYQLGFSVQNGVICSLLRGGIAERGGIRVGHRIIEINGQSVVAVSHDRIVNILATSVGEIQMKTMPTSIFRLLTGQDVPHYI